MYYLIILLAVIFFTVQFSFTKVYERTVPPSAQTSLVMTALTGIAGALLYLAAGGFSVRATPVTLIWAGIMAAVMIPYYLIGVKVLSVGSLAVYSMFMMLGGMLVPFLYGVLFLEERLTPGRAAGTVLLSVFIVLQALWQRSPDRPEGKSSKSGRRLFILLCVLIFFINGMTGVIAKAHQISPGASDEISFTVLSCAFTSALSLILLALSGKKAVPAFSASLKPKPLAVAALLGFAAYTGSYLHLTAAGHVPASVQFPLVSGGVIVLSALASRFIFKEKASKREWICVAGAFLATALFAF